MCEHGLIYEQSPVVGSSRTSHPLGSSGSIPAASGSTLRSRLPGDQASSSSAATWTTSNHASILKESSEVRGSNAACDLPRNPKARRVAKPTVDSVVEKTRAVSTAVQDDLGVMDTPESADLDMDMNPVPTTSAAFLPAGTDPASVSSTEGTPAPARASVHPESSTGTRSAAPTSSAPRPKSRGKSPGPPTALESRQPSQSAASAAAAAAIAAWNARFSPQVDDTFFAQRGIQDAAMSDDPVWGSTTGAATDATNRSTSPETDPPIAEALTSPIRSPTPPAVMTATVNIVSTLGSPVALSLPPPASAATRDTTPTPETDTAVVISPLPPPPVPAAHKSAAPIVPKKRFSSLMKPVIHDLSSKSRARSGVPEKVGVGSGSTGNRTLSERGGESKDALRNGTRETIRPLSTMGESSKRSSTSTAMKEKDRALAEREESGRKEPRRVRVRSPSPPTRRKGSDLPHDNARDPSPAAEGHCTPSRSRPTASRPSGTPARRTNGWDPYAEELRVDPVSDEDYEPPSTRKESRTRTGWGVELRPVRRRRDLPRREVYRDVRGDSGDHLPSARKDSRGRESGTASARKNVDLDVEGNGTSLPSDREQPTTSKRQGTRETEVRASRPSTHRGDKEATLREPRFRSPAHLDRQLPSTRHVSLQKGEQTEEPFKTRKSTDESPAPERRSSAAARPTSTSRSGNTLTDSQPEEPSSSRSKEYQRPAPVQRSRAMRLEVDEESSRRARTPRKEVHEKVVSTTLEDQGEALRRTGSRAAAFEASALAQKEWHPASSPRRFSSTPPRAQSPVPQSQRTQLPPPPISRSANGNFQDYLRRSQIGKKGSGPSRLPPVIVEKRKRIEETPREARVPPAKALAPRDPEPTDDCIMQIDAEPENPSPKLPTPPPIPEPLPPPPVSRDKSKPWTRTPSASAQSKETSSDALMFASTLPKDSSSKAARLAAKQAQIEKLLEEHDTVLREMFHLEQFKTMVVGYDPRIAKKETSNVWKEVSPSGCLRACLIAIGMYSGKRHMTLSTSSSFLKRKSAGSMLKRGHPQGERREERWPNR